MLFLKKCPSCPLNHAYFHNVMIKDIVPVFYFVMCLSHVSASKFLA